MTIPFTYKLVFKPTKQYYYGVRWAKGCSPNDFWITYFTSSKHIKKLINEYGKNSFEFKVTKTFSNKIDAGNWETAVLERVKTNKNSKFINKTNNMPVYDSSGLKVIHHIETGIGTFHDQSIPISDGWKYGQSDKHKENNKKAHTKLYSDGKYKAWNKGGGKPTGKCSEKRRIAISNSRMNTPKSVCEHCNKKIDPGNFKRFHGDNCKMNPDINQNVLKKRSEKAKNSMRKQKERGTFSKPKTLIGIFKCPFCSKESINYGSMKRHHFNKCKAKGS